MKMTNLNLKKAQRLINKGAKLWEIGNNSGNSDVLAQKEKESQTAYRRAEKIIKEIYPNIIITYPGLYPNYQLNDCNFYNLESLEHYNPIKDGVL
jgi:phosphoketolase